MPAPWPCRPPGRLRGLGRRAPERRTPATVQRGRSGPPDGTAAGQASAPLFAVTDAVDRAGPVVGHEHRSIGSHDYISRAPGEIVLALDPSARKHRFLGV